MKDFYIEAGENIKIRGDTVWALWFLAKDSLEEGDLNEFLDIFEILKRTMTDPENTKLSKNLSMIINSLTNRYQKYLNTISNQLKEAPVLDESLVNQPPIQKKKATDWENRLKEIRSNYPRAYISWNKEEENQLEKLFNTGLTPSEISKKLKRQPSAIRSRLRRLGLIT